MKWLVLISVAIAAVSAGVIKDFTEGYKDGDRYFFFPGDGDNVLHLVDALEPVDEAFIKSYTRDPNNNAFWLYTRANPTVAQVISIGNVNSVLNTNFDVTKITVFLAHGWNGDGNNDMNKELTEAFLENGDVNVIVLDWNELANRGYTTAKRGVAEVGRGLGQFVAWLSESVGLSLDRVHLVGHSLGGHLVGNAGRELQGQVKRITVLDPAGPLWGSDPDRVAPTDGRYVEIIHTSRVLGLADQVGDVDHYPNGGTHQPGCLLSTCSHSRSWKFMAATVKDDHLLANRCETYDDAKDDSCTGDLYPMGNADINKQQTGIFRVNTGKEYPY